MKKIYVALLLLLVGGLTVRSQSIILLPNDSSEISEVVTDGFQPYDIHIEAVNNTASTVTFTWGLSNYNAPAEWEIALCDNNNCYSLLLAPGPHISNSVAAGDTMDMKFQYTSHCTDGVGNTNIYVYITHDSVSSVQFLNYKADLTNNCLSGIADKSAADNIKIYPNPIQHSFVVSGLENAGNLSFEVYDLKGALVKSKAIGTGNAQIEISIESLNAGEYILKAYDAKGKIAGTSRLNKID